MTRAQYLSELESQLYFLNAEERDDILKEFTSHMDDSASSRPDLNEEELVARLPPPASVAARYFSEEGGATSAPGQAPGGPGSAGSSGSQGSEGSEGSRGSRGGRRGRGNFRFDFDMGSFFRSARYDDGDISGSEDGIQRVEIRVKSSDISAERGDRFSYRASGSWDEDEAPRIECSNGLWRLDCKDSLDDLTLVLPPGLVELLVVSTSGDLDAELPEGTNVTAKLVSGDVTLECEGGTVALDTTSGDININGLVDEVTIRSASGDIYVEGLRKSFLGATASGEIEIECESPDVEIKAQSMSGGIELTLADDAHPEIRAESVTGEVRAPGERRSRGPVGRTVHRPGGPAQVYLKTVSGDIRVHE